MSERMSGSEAYALIYGHFPMEDDSDPMVAPYIEAQGWVVQMGPDSYTNDMPDAPYEDAKMLAHAKRALRTIVAVGEALTWIEEAENRAHADWIRTADTHHRDAALAYTQAVTWIRYALGDTDE